MPIVVAAGALLGPAVFAQELGDTHRGLELARSTCAICHGIRKGEESNNRRAPSFNAIANVKGMSIMALNVALLSSHRSMPNIVLDARERADVIAYILTLKTE